MIHAPVTFLKVWLRDNISEIIKVGVVEETPWEGVEFVVGENLIESHPRTIPIVRLDLEAERQFAYPSCALTRQQCSTTEPTSALLADIPANAPQFVREQRMDKSLARLLNLAKQGNPDVDGSCFYLRNNGLLMRKWCQRNAPSNDVWEERHQLVIPAKLTGHMVIGCVVTLALPKP